MKRNSVGWKILAHLESGPKTVLTLARTVGMSVNAISPKMDMLLDEGHVIFDGSHYRICPDLEATESLPPEMKGRTCVWCGGRDATHLSVRDGKMVPTCGTCGKPKVPTKTAHKRLIADSFIARCRRAVEMLKQNGEPTETQDICRALGLEPDSTNMRRVWSVVNRHLKFVNEGECRLSA